jgi:hypothetical protein
VLHLVHIVLEVHLLRDEIGKFFIFLGENRTLHRGRVAWDVESSSRRRSMRDVSDRARNGADASCAETSEERGTVVRCRGGGHFDASNEFQKTGRYQLRVSDRKHQSGRENRQ